MVLRDSVIYAAEEMTRFEVINVCDSANPAVASSCSLRMFAQTRDVCVQDSLAYVANTWGGLRIIDVADSRKATPVGIYMAPRDVYSVAVRDSIAFVGTDQDLRIVNVKDPQAPFEIGGIATWGNMVRGIRVRGDSLLITNRFSIMDVSDLGNPRSLAFYDIPLTPRGNWEEIGTVTISVAAS
jgi:hypothetical protein